MYFISKIDDVPVGEGAQHRPVYVVQNRMMVGMFSVWYTMVPGILNHGGIWHTHTGK